jgi:hypothetical protein
MLLLVLWYCSTVYSSFQTPRFTAICYCWYYDTAVQSYSSFQTPCFTAVCYYWSYDTAVQFQFWFLGHQSTFKEILVSIIRFIFQVLFYIGSLFLLSYHYSQLIPDICRTEGVYIHSFFNIDSFTGQNPFGSCIVADVCIRNPENNINNHKLVPEEAHQWIVLLLQQYRFILLTHVI